MVYQMVLRDFEGNIGWLIAFVYLLCGALRLARFNCYAQAKQPNDPPSDEFVGFPIPAAAGLIASLTLFMLWLQEGERTIGQWKYALAALMLFLSFMMFSHVRYPSFKGLGWRSQRSIPRFLIIIVIIVFSAVNYQWMPALMFVLFLIYGFVRPFISKAWRREIEEDEGDHPDVTPATESKFLSGRFLKRHADGEVPRALRLAVPRRGIHAVVEADRADGQIVAKSRTDGVAHVLKAEIRRVGDDVACIGEDCSEEIANDREGVFQVEDSEGSPPSGYPFLSRGPRVYSEKLRTVVAPPLKNRSSMGSASSVSEEMMPPRAPMASDDRAVMGT